MTKNVEVPSNLANDLLWGADEIGSYLRRKRNAVYHLAAKGFIPTKKIGATLVALRSELDRSIASLDAVEPPKPIKPMVERVQPRRKRGR